MKNNTHISAGIYFLCGECSPQHNKTCLRVSGITTHPTSARPATRPRPRHPTHPPEAGATDRRLRRARWPPVSANWAHARKAGPRPLREMQPDAGVSEPTPTPTPTPHSRDSSETHHSPPPCPQSPPHCREGYVFPPCCCAARGRARESDASDFRRRRRPVPVAGTHGWAGRFGLDEAAGGEAGYFFSEDYDYFHE